MRQQGFGPRTVDLDDILPGYRKIGEAPGLSDIYAQGNSVEEERGREYKAKDQYGNVYLIMNPAVWPVVIVNGMTVGKRPKPRLMFNSSAALEEAKKPRSAPLALPGIPTTSALPTNPELNFGFLG